MLNFHRVHMRLWLTLILLLGVLTGYMAADTARSWMVTTVEVPGSGNRIQVSAVDMGDVCLYVATRSSHNTAMWGIEKSRIGGKCQ